MWTYTSVILLMVIYELMVVPLLEILPEENLIFIAFVLGGICCAQKTRYNAVQASQEIVPGLELGEGSGNMCNVCKRRVPSKACHCRVCQTCVFRREYHCKWLDCCIGLTNLKWYLACLLLSSAAFMYGSNLTMTTICHPYQFMGPILLPDDCSDVYSQLDTAICFVSSVYSLSIALVMLWHLAYHLWLMYLGTTTYERRLYKSENHYSQGLLENIRYLLCCKSPYFSYLTSSQYSYQR
ncbi:hypothetical protein QAD02_000107 [Eretmocerus hayati]|uniref:Uncharacterized protein n=1 Tax=Eretmocerus hayati TaxID=131215 RepID=A0ACC2ND03_9HYME|nr:hypothetical protein QAD02_000107 [Eretmocerus hayati]